MDKELLKAAVVAAVKLNVSLQQKIAKLRDEKKYDTWDYTSLVQESAKLCLIINALQSLYV